MINDSDLMRLLQVAEQATPGPWEYHGLTETYEISRVENGRSLSPRVVAAVLTDYQQCSDPQNPKGDGGVTNFRDAEFIALANPDVVRALVDEVMVSRIARIAKGV